MLAVMAACPPHRGSRQPDNRHSEISKGALRLSKYIARFHGTCCLVAVGLTAHVITGRAQHVHAHYRDGKEVSSKLLQEFFALPSLQCTLRACCAMSGILARTSTAIEQCHQLRQQIGATPPSACWPHGQASAGVCCISLLALCSLPGLIPQAGLCFWVVAVDAAAQTSRAQPLSFFRQGAKIRC